MVQTVEVEMRSRTKKYWSSTVVKLEIRVKMNQLMLGILVKRREKGVDVVKGEYPNVCQVTVSGNQKEKENLVSIC